MVRAIELSRLCAFGLWLRRGRLDWRCLCRELLWLLSVLLCWFLLALSVGSGWRQIGKATGLILRPILSRSLSNALFVGMLRIYRLGLSLYLLLVLLVHGLMIEFTGGWVWILVWGRCDWCRNFLVENSRENILMLLLLLWDCLWDIGAQVVLLVEVGGMVLIFG
jgi:hypothetical protein